MRTLAPLVTMLVAVIPAASQTPAQKPAFEVASVKPNNSGSNSGSFHSTTSANTESGHFAVVNATLKFLIVSAYGLFEYQLVGGPDWINTARFDIEARAAATDLPLPTPKSTGGGPDVMSLMIQSLLEERFQLKTHRETRELPVFNLTVAKDGDKLQRTVEGRPGPGGLSSGSSRSSTTATGAEMSGSGVTIPRLLNMISTQAGRLIIDKTNLSGRYDFVLKFTPAQMTTTGPAGDAVAESSGPSLFTALQEQLGLKLESARGPVEVLVIDSVERPSEN